MPVIRVRSPLCAVDVSFLALFGFLEIGLFQFLIEPGFRLYNIVSRQRFRLQDNALHGSQCMVHAFPAQF